MVLSHAAKAAAKILAKKAAIARAHRIKKTARPRVKKTSLLDASGNQIYTKSGKPKTKKLTQRQMHNRLDNLQDDYHSYQKIGDKKGMNRIIKKSEAIEKSPNFKRGYFEGGKFIPYSVVKKREKAIRRRGYVAASDNMSDSDLKRNLVGTSKDGIYHTGLETSRIHTAPAARKYVPPLKGNLQDKEYLRLSRQSFTKKDRLRRDLTWDPSLRAHLGWQGPKRPGAWFQGPPPPDTWKGVLTDKESLGFAVPSSVAFTSVFWASRSHAEGKTLTGKDLPESSGNRDKRHYLKKQFPGKR